MSGTAALYLVGLACCLLFLLAVALCRTASDALDPDYYYSEEDGMRFTTTRELAADMDRAYNLGRAERDTDHEQSVEGFRRTIDGLTARARDDAERIRLLTHQVDILQAANEAMDVPIGVDVAPGDWRRAVSALARQLTTTREKNR